MENVQGRCKIDVSIKNLFENDYFSVKFESFLDAGKYALKTFTTVKQELF